MGEATHFSTKVLERICRLCLGDFRDFSVLVIGDIMLDKYISGKVKRISPEAPVPVFLVGEQYSVLGGAGNVVNNLLHLGVRTSYIGRVGDDAEGSVIENMLLEAGAAVPCLLKRRIFR